MNPIHLDDRFARSVGLPGVISQGMLQMSVAAVVAGKGAGGAQNLRRLSCRFASMVQPGDNVTFRAEEVEPGKLPVSAVNRHRDVILTKGVADFSAGGSDAA